MRSLRRRRGRMRRIRKNMVMMMMMIMRRRWKRKRRMKMIMMMMIMMRRRRRIYKKMKRTRRTVRWKRRRRRGIRRWKIKKRRSTFSSSRAAPYRSPALAGKLCFLQKEKMQFRRICFSQTSRPCFDSCDIFFLAVFSFNFKFKEVQIGITPVPGGTREIYKRAFNLLGGVNQGRGHLLARGLEKKKHINNLLVQRIYSLGKGRI